MAIGYRHTDTAPMHANGDAVGGVPREEMFLTSKVCDAPDQARAALPKHRCFVDPPFAPARD